MKKKAFKLPMSKTEAIIGWIFVFFYTFALSYILGLIDAYLFPKLGFSLSTANFNLLYYAFSFVFLLVFMFKFMKTSFSYMTSSLKDMLFSVGVGYLAYNVLAYLLSLILSLFLSDLVNPNSAAVIAQTKLNPNVMLVIGVLLAPIVEEVLFRGVVFGTIRRRNRVLAYIVSSVFFAVYHLWGYMLEGFDLSLLLYLTQYIPAGIVLAWCYERGGSFRCPVFMHMLVNYVSLSITIG